METPELSEKTEIRPQYVALDWLTATAKGLAARAKLDALGKGIVREEVRSGARSFSWRWNGYEGEATRFVRWGVRDDTSILVLVSQAANIYWRNVRGIDVKPTRVDIKVDFEDKGGNAPGLVRRVYESLRAIYTGNKSLSFWEDARGGETVYVGSRQSEQMLRLYDKTAQRGELGGGARLYRCELELKRKAAQQFWATLLTQADPTPFIIATIRTKVLRANLPLFLPEVTIDFGATDTFISIKDDERTVTWLRRSVAPAILRLVEAGRLEEVERALGVKLFWP